MGEVWTVIDKSKALHASKTKREGEKEGERKY